VGGRKRWIPHLVGGIVGVLVLVATHIAGSIDNIPSAGDTLALSGGIEALLVGTSVLAGIRQSIHSSCCLSSLKQILKEKLVWVP